MPIAPEGRQTAYSYDELISCSEEKLFGPGNAQLPSPPMLMLDRITEMSLEGGKYERGYLHAELDIKRELWFFDCHFKGDPVMPGCLGLDAMWQLVGFYLGWTGSPGKGRALGVGEVKFTGQIEPHIKTVKYVIDMKRVMKGRLVLGIADGIVLADDEAIYSAKDMKVGLIQQKESA